MKVAIIGAGVAGLSCAIELQRHGITPEIFEETKMLGDKPGNLVAWLRLFYRSLRSPMSFVNSRYGIQLTPLHPIKEMIMYAPNKTVSTKANHGYVLIKGIDQNSIEHQISAYTKATITFDKHVKIQDIKNEYEYIVIATGNRLIAEELGIWKTTFNSRARIATLAGDFAQDTMMMWLNKSFAKNGYGYLLAKNSNEAELVLAVSDIKMDKLDHYWNEFWFREKLIYNVTKQHDVDHIIGYPTTNQLDNLLFIGNAGGMLDDFLGFGTLRSLECGIMAARAIVNKQDFNKLIAPYRKDVKALHEYRKMLNLLNNKDLDMDMSIIGIPGLKHALYNNLLYRAQYGIWAPKALQYLKKKNHPFKEYTDEE